MDVVGSERAAFFGVSEGGPMSILFAATHPQRTSALILYGTYARRMWATDHPWGRTESLNGCPAGATLRATLRKAAVLTS